MLHLFLCKHAAQGAGHAVHAHLAEKAWMQLRTPLLPQNENERDRPSLLSHTRRLLSTRRLADLAPRVKHAEKEKL